MRGRPAASMSKVRWPRTLGKGRGRWDMEVAWARGPRGVSCSRPWLMLLSTTLVLMRPRVGVGPWAEVVASWGCIDFNLALNQQGAPQGLSWTWLQKGCRGVQGKGSELGWAPSTDQRWNSLRQKWRHWLKVLQRAHGRAGIQIGAYISPCVTSPISYCLPYDRPINRETSCWGKGLTTFFGKPADRWRWWTSVPKNHPARVRIQASWCPNPLGLGSP